MIEERTLPAGLRVVISDARGRRLGASGLARWMAAVAPSRARGVVSVALVGDARMRLLNRQYRRLDCATDVLSFPAGEHDLAQPERYLGEIVIALGVARRQARAAGHAEASELRLLALHGLLHLLGYDHERDEGQMERLERKLRRKGGLDEGLLERHLGRTVRMAPGRAGLPPQGRRSSARATRSHRK